MRRRPPGKSGSGAPPDDDKAFAGGRAMERVKQFERARGLGPPMTAQAPDLPAGTKVARKGKSGKTGRRARAKPSRRKGKSS